MAKAVIIIEDIDLNDGTVRSEVTIEGTQLDDGHCTAAHFFGAYIKDRMRDPKFLADVWAYAEGLMQQTPGATLTNPDRKIVVAANDAAEAA